MNNSSQKEAAAKRPAPPQPSSLNNAEFLNLAHQRLDQIFQEMEGRQDHGTIGVELAFERGQVTMIRRTLNGTDRPAR